MIALRTIAVRIDVEAHQCQKVQVLSRLEVAARNRERCILDL